MIPSIIKCSIKYQGHTSILTNLRCATAIDHQTDFGNTNTYQKNETFRLIQKKGIQTGAQLQVLDKDARQKEFPQKKHYSCHSSS